MYSSSYDPGRRYRRRAAERKKRLTTQIMLLLSCGLFGYWLGGEVVRSSEAAFKQEAMSLREEKEALQEQVTELRAQIQSTQIVYKQLEERYSTEVPTGELKELTELAREQLEDGISKDRLAFVIRSARPPRNCTEPKSKRFVVKTPVYNGPDSNVAFADGTVTITGEGEAAVSADGNPEAWFDPGKPVKLTFTQIGGQDMVKNGLLPIHHSMVIGEREYRFTAAKGNRSFVTVTSDSCDYP